MMYGQERHNLIHGIFEQRYYSNGELAPSWGLQIDETAAILIGLHKHANYLFLEDMILKATVALMNFIDGRGLSKPCYDLWEERLGEHTYSAASVVGALKAGAYIANELQVVEPYAEMWNDDTL